MATGKGAGTKGEDTKKKITKAGVTNKKKKKKEDPTTAQRVLELEAQLSSLNKTIKTAQSTPGFDEKDEASQRHLIGLQDRRDRDLSKRILDLVTKDKKTTQDSQFQQNLKTFAAMQQLNPFARGSEKLPSNIFKFDNPFRPLLSALSTGALAAFLNRGEGKKAEAEVEDEDKDTPLGKLQVKTTSGEVITVADTPDGAKVKKNIEKVVKDAEDLNDEEGKLNALLNDPSQRIHLQGGPEADVSNEQIIRFARKVDSNFMRPGRGDEQEEKDKANFAKILSEIKRVRTEGTVDLDNIQGESSFNPFSSGGFDPFGLADMTSKIFKAKGEEVSKIGFPGRIDLNKSDILKKLILDVVKASGSPFGSTDPEVIGEAAEGIDINDPAATAPSGEPVIQTQQVDPADAPEGLGDLLGASTAQPLTLDQLALDQQSNDFERFMNPAGQQLSPGIGISDVRERGAETMPIADVTGQNFDVPLDIIRRNNRRMLREFLLVRGAKLPGELTSDLDIARDILI